MRAEIVVLMVAVGLSVWALRVLPIMLMRADMPKGGAMARFFAATGVAAIATLFAAGILPEFGNGRIWPALAGSVAVVAVYWPSKSVVLATVAGAAVYGGVFAVLA